MLNMTQITIDRLSDRLDFELHALFPAADAEISQCLRSAVRLSIERLGTSDALYHNIEHTLMVVFVGLDILNGRHMRERIDADDWLHFVVALLCHDVGYVRGACLADSRTHFVVDDQGMMIEAPRGASDAWLTPHHVTRSKIFVMERASAMPRIDPIRVADAIELTRFPVPDDGDHDDTAGEPGLVRAADLIGQLADPGYPRKHNALFHEFRETGTAQKLGYETPADLADSYPVFFWACIKPFVGRAIELLEETQEGRATVAQLYAHVFAIEHELSPMGPQRVGRNAEHP